MSRSRKRPYTGSKRFDRSCRNHGGCSYCAGNRKHFDLKARTVAAEKISEVMPGRARSQTSARGVTGT